MNLQALTRQMDLIPFNKLSERVNMIGCGAIGSHTSLALAKMGITNQIIWDHDMVDIVNMNAQGYPLSAVGKPKVEAMRDIILDHTGDTVEIKYEKYEAQSLHGIVVAAVDSMAVRHMIWRKVKGNPSVKFFIDPRMSIEYALMFTVNPNSEKDIAMYEKTLYSDENSVQEPCTLKSVIYTANFISGLIAKTVKDIIVGKPYPRVCTWDIGENSLEVYKGEQWKS